MPQLWESLSAGNAAPIAAAVSAAADNTTSTASVVNSDAPVGSVIIANNTFDNRGLNQAINTNISNNNGNNNYVNFNQFIMQHNLLGGPGANSNDTDSGCGVLTPSAQIDVGNNFGMLQDYSGTSNVLNDEFFGFAQNPNANMNTKAANFSDYNQPQQSNFFNSNSNLFQYNNVAASPNNIYTNGIDGNGGGGDCDGTLPSNNIYENLYTPFGNNGTTYYANPFATGFDFNASNLQVSAPEFVPRFGNLTLNDHKQQTMNSENSFECAGNNSSKFPNSSNAQLNASISKMNNNGADPQLQQQQQQNINVLETQMGYDKFLNSATRDASVLSPGHQQQQQQQSRSTGATNKNALRSNGPNGYMNNSNNNNNNSNYNYRYERNHERFNGERAERGSYGNRERGDRDRERGDYHQRFDENVNGGGSQRLYGGDNKKNKINITRSNKRRDDWNRNRDRINGFRVEEKYSTDTGKDSPSLSPEKKTSPRKIYPENEKLSQREKLIRDIEMRRLECLVCVEPIKGHHSVWSCNNCYHILHLQCIIKWASSSKSDDGWRCPACQNVVKEVPRDYYCFCGKVKNPQYNRQDIAHSCGEVCGRVEGCAHACALLCHPGPCPPCQANVKRECGCGKTTKVMQCCLKETIECDETCGKLLNCELHTCSAKCHEGKCEPCAEKVEQICHCSKQERQVACTRDSHDKHTYSCGKPCGRNLTCGNHKCKDCCHGGECRPCKLSPEVVTSCPCGKMPVLEGQRTSCLDAIPVCEGVCSKTLRCGKAAHPHHCTSKCHLGNCPPCNKQTAVKCRCGHMDQMIKCRQLSTRADDARCKKRCVKKRSCGKHKCNQECCIDIDHICPLPCNYTLSCGKHKCDQPCHRGNCPPCYRSSFEELYCECGAEVIYPPVPCGTKRPICKRHCSRSHPCDHPPQHNCHSAASCPPCMMFTTKWCFGHHEQRKTIPCSQESFSCGLACNKELPCGRHKCIKSCHEGVCQVAGEICKQSCTKLRTACGHKCMAPCHDGDCPETPCKEMVEVQCECGNRKQMRSCHDLVREYSRIATAQLASSMAEMQRGNYMELSEILAPVKVNKTNKTLDCNEECRLLERNRRLAIGLQIRNPDLPQKLLTKYSDFIRGFAKRDPILVKNIYDALTNLVKLAKESKQKSRSHSFPTMNREKRQLVHELCEMFGVESVAYDAEPNRNVVATAYKDRSWLPATSIMEVMQRESGQRRVPVPSNNAWGIKR